jgi:hypothetical protein
MFIKMEEPKDFVTWLQVAKVMIVAYFVGGTAENKWYFNTVLLFQPFVTGSDRSESDCLSSRSAFPHSSAVCTVQSQLSPVILILTQLILNTAKV